VSADDKFVIKMIKYEKLETLSKIKIGSPIDIIRVENIWKDELNFE